MDSLDHSSPPPTNLLCPKVLFLDHMNPKTYSKFFNIEKLNDSSLEGRHNLFPLDWSKTKTDEEMFCLACRRSTITSTGFWCDKCDVTYHKECVESPIKIKVPYHPKHSLQLLCLPLRSLPCDCCGEDRGALYYSCSICEFNFHPSCAIRPNILSINYPKRHEHTLTYFPRKNSLTCDVCALGDGKSFFYICYQCDFLVHHTCIYLPTTIRICRHDHRISFTPSLSDPTRDPPCGVCRKSVARNYGEYTCVKGCNYFVHSKCATRRDLWDGRELEGEPEIEYGDIKSFEEVGDGIIKHFSHSNHYMRLENKVDGEKRCQACIFPIYEGNAYSCTKCDFILHQACAYLPRVKWHQLHAHPLTLQVDQKIGGRFECNACGRDCCGFKYTCSEDSCYFDLDVRCALVSEPFVHKLHPDPLFLTSEEGRLGECSICGRQQKQLNCIICSFVLCFECATTPYKVKYRDDEHYLTFFFEKNAKRYHWCEICERTINPKRGYYICNVCSVTLHVDCLLGADPFMKYGQSFVYNEVTFLTIPNNRLTRLICKTCKTHSPYRIAFTTSAGVLFCSMKCLRIYSKTGYKETLRLTLT